MTTVVNVADTAAPLPATGGKTVSTGRIALVTRAGAGYVEEEAGCREQTSVEQAAVNYEAMRAMIFFNGGAGTRGNGSGD